MRFSQGFMKEASRLNGGAFHEELKRIKDMFLLRLVNADKEDDFRFLQGTIQSLDTLIEAIEGAREALKEIENKKPDMNKVF